MSRENDWLEFSNDVQNHIVEYTIPQYGDKGNDLASEYSIEDCKGAMLKYLARMGKNQRPGQSQLDMMKIAHYAQMAYTIMGEQE